jgi:hypothetical protein
MLPFRTTGRLLSSSVLALLATFATAPAQAQEAPPSEAEASTEADQAAAPDVDAQSSDDYVEEGSAAGTDIFSANTLTFMADLRLVLANGHTSFADGGFGKTRFDGNAHGDFELKAMPIEAALIWQPRFTSSVSGNVSVMWQNDQENLVDLIEAYATWVPRQNGNLNFAAKAGLYFPEISLEHATGGGWSTVYTITPSAINTWIGEEVKVVGAEGTMRATLGDNDFVLTAGAFGFNDTSGTLLSFRGWGLHDMLATAFGHFKLPPLNPFMSRAQEHRTRSLFEIDDRVGFYGRAEWRPSTSFMVNAFYYDNRGDPEAVVRSHQWGWRTRFWNVGLVADLPADIRLIAQGMTGTTLMGFKTGGIIWIDTRYRSAFALLTRPVGAGAVSVRGEWFDTKERGSQMVHADESEDGWALTGAVRWPVWKLVTLFVEALHVESTRGARVREGIPPRENQTVLQAALRLRW